MSEYKIEYGQYDVWFFIIGMLSITFFNVLDTYFNFIFWFGLIIEIIIMTLVFFSCKSFIMKRRNDENHKRTAKGE